MRLQKLHIQRLTNKTKVILCFGLLMISIAFCSLNYLKSNPSPVKSVFFENAPLIQLRGTLSYHTFAGPPNYESITQGDMPEPAWILKLDRESSQKMWSNPITQYTREHFPDLVGDGSVQLAIDRSDQEMSSFQGKTISIEGFLGPWETYHVHTPFLLEVVNIHEK